MKLGNMLKMGLGALVIASGLGLGGLANGSGVATAETQVKTTHKGKL